MQQSREAGFVAHLVKPVNLPQLDDAIAKIAGAGTRPVFERV
jgi:CheY-like chemotaxis protein